MNDFGGMISFTLVDDSLAASRKVCESTRVFALAESLGGVESLIEHPALMTHASVPAERRAALGINDSLIRLSCGIEDAEDLIADLAQAIDMSDREHGMAVVGAGLVGSLTALLLANRGHHVDVYERRQDPRKVGDAAGRSINLALSERGWRALEKAGAVEAVRSIAMPVKARCMHGRDGGLTYQPYGLPGKGRFGHDQCIYSVARGPLNRILLEAAEATGRVNVHFEHRLSDFTTGEAGVTLDFEGRDSVAHDRIFGTDGAFSAVRQRMMKTDRFDFSQSYLEHGYKEIAMPPNAAGDFAIDPEALHIWPRGHFMLMALPNPDRTFTCTLFAPFEGQTEFSGIPDADAARRYFESHFPDVLPLVPDFDADWTSNPTSSLVTTRCNPWHLGDRVLLLGDAAHAIVPFYGQGMNSGFEDARVLADLLDAHGGTIPDAAWRDLMGEFTALRKANGDAIGDLGPPQLR